MNYILYIIPLIFFIIFFYAVVSINKRKNKQAGVANIFSKEFYSDLKKYRTIINDLNKRIDELQNSLSIANVKSHKLERINKELLEEKDLLQKQLENIETLSRKKEELFTMFIHDIKNPAGAIKNLTELLNSYDLSMNEQRDVIISILRTADKILNLADEITKVVVYESNFKMDIRPCSVKHTINEAYLMNNIKAKKKNQKIEVSVSESVSMVEMDSDKIEQALDNLLSNAIKFSPANTTIKVNAFKKNSNLTIEVIDQGPGLTYEDIQNAFQKGKRLSTNPTDGEKSTGLGLWIVKRIITEHKGTVLVESNIGSGSKFIFQIPITQN